MSSKGKIGARDFRYFEERLISWPRDLHWLNMIFSFFLFLCVVLVLNKLLQKPRDDSNLIVELFLVADK